MKSVKKIFMVTIGIFVICLATTNVSALSVDEFNNTGKFNTIPEEKKMVEGVLDERLRSTLLPTNSLDLSRQSYKTNIVRATKSWLYTDVYFKVASNRTINISYNLSSKNGQNARIGVYDMTTSSWVQIKNGLNGSMSVTDLNSSHKYAVVFAGYQTGMGTTIISGTAIISN